MAFADLDGIRIHYELDGDEGRQALVLSNSLGSNASMWQPQIVTLASQIRILRYDPRGHGKSSVPDGPSTIADLGLDVLGLLDRLGIEKASFCGISMGGVVGQWLAVNAPNRLDRLVLANTAAKIGTAETWNARIAIVQQDGPARSFLERWNDGLQQAFVRPTERPCPLSRPCFGPRTQEAMPRAARRFAMPTFA